MTQQIPPKMTITDIARAFTMDELFEALSIKMNSHSSPPVPPDCVCTYSFQSLKAAWDSVDDFKNHVALRFKQDTYFQDLVRVQEITYPNPPGEYTPMTYLRGMIRYMDPTR